MLGGQDSSAVFTERGTWRPTLLYNPRSNFACFGREAVTVRTLKQMGQAAIFQTTRHTYTSCSDLFPATNNDDRPGSLELNDRSQELRASP